MVDKFQLSVEDFSLAFGRALSVEVESEIEKHDFEIEPIVGQSRDELIVEILEKIRTDTQIIGAPTRTQSWSGGWGENLEAFQVKPALDTLVPKFIRPGYPIRWGGKFYRASNPRFEEAFIRVLRSFLFSIVDTELGPQGPIHLYEFGAGTGWNLLHAHEWFGDRGREIHLYGSDFVDTSIKLMGLMSSQGIPINANLFDMRAPDPNYKIGVPHQSAVFTLGALEQLAGEIEPMIDYLMSQSPRVVIHVEPDSDTYDRSKLEDYLAYWFQDNRGYSSGLGRFLGHREAKGDIEVLLSKRVGFGSRMMEGYNLVVWRPRI